MKSCVELVAGERLKEEESKKEEGGELNLEEERVMRSSRNAEEIGVAGPPVIFSADE